MAQEPYTKKVMKHFLKPKHFGEIKDADAIGKAGNMKCLPKDELIQTNPDLIEIGNLNTCTKVLSHDGQFHEITKKFVRKSRGHIIKLKNRLGETKITPEHLVKAIKVPQQAKYLRIKNKMKLKPAWYHAHELERNDIALYPLPKTVSDIKYINVTNKRIKMDFKSKYVPDKIKLNNDFLRLAGYFIAEGNISLKTTRVNVSFSFGSHETEYINDVIRLLENIFKIKARTHTFKNCTKVIANNVHLARFFYKLFGNGCKTKKLPAFMLFLPIKKQRDLIKGLWRGDGFINKKIPRAGYSTISCVIANQLKFLLLRQGIIPSLYTEKEKVSKGVKHKKSYRIHVGSWSIRKLAEILDEKIENKMTTKDSWVDKDYFYFPITNVSKENYNGKLYNCEVENAHTYTTNSLLVHNCGDVMHLYLKVKGRKIIDAKFKTLGCAAAIATSDVLCEIIKGKTIAAAKKVTNKDIVDYLEMLPTAKLHCSVLGISALKDALKELK